MFTGCHRHQPGHGRGDARCTWPTTSWGRTARARSWRSPPTTTGTPPLRPRTACRRGWWWCPTPARRAAGREGRGAAGGRVFSGDGVATASSCAATGLSLDGLSSPDARSTVTAWLTAQSLGGPRVNYKLRDWLFARQRYWGEPFPIVYRADGGPDAPPEAVPEHSLPLTLPPMVDFQPSGTPDPPLATVADWITFTTRPRGSSTGGRRPPCPSGPARAGTTCGTSTRPMPRRSSSPKPSSTGCRWTCTWAGRSTPSCTCCTRASGTRSCSTWASCRRASRSSASCPRA